MLGERLQYILYKDHSTWGQFIDRNNAYHTVCVPSSFRSIHYGGSWGPSTHTSLCVCLKCCPPVTRQAGETADGQQPGGWEDGGEGSSAGGGAGQSARLRRGACRLCGIPQCQCCQCHEEHITCQSGDVFRLGAAWSPSGTRITTQLVFCLVKEPPRGNSYSEH